MGKQIYQIYDRIFKRIFSLSNLAIINLINGLFHTNYPTDSILQYTNKEFVSAPLEKRFADVLVTIQGHPYHLEAQMTIDGSIVVRAFEYGFQYAVVNRDKDTVLHFPDPIIIYLNEGKNIPETSSLVLEFGSQGAFTYEVRNFIFQEHEISELNQKKMIILIPFHLLKLQKIIQKTPTEENFVLLQNLIQDDILGSIKANLTVGNITADDANELRELTLQLGGHIFAHYKKLGGYENMKALLEGALELPLDKYRIRIDELEQEKEAIAQENQHLQEELRKLKEQMNTQ